MTVVRYTFDVCIRKSYPHDTYTLASQLAESIMKTEGVCGCEACSTHSDIVNSVDVGKIIALQNEHGTVVGRTGGAS